MGSAQSLQENDYTNIKRTEEIKFYLHDKEHVAKCEDISPDTSLNVYLRHTLQMTGTKFMCGEGGCGACVVVLQSTDPITNKNVSLAVNSCLVPLLSCNGWKISTIEGVGNSIKGYHPLQEVLAQFNGTQCGFCSPGMVMNMFALYESGKLTMNEVEDSFGGNLCRCTGYRPILSAFKSLCTDASVKVLGECPDVEDFVLCYKEKCGKKCMEEFPKVSKEQFSLDFSSSKWIKIHSLKDLLKILNTSKEHSYRLVAGNTAQGVYNSYKTKVYLYIDITDVPELKQHEVQEDSCILGAGTTLTDTIEFFKEVASRNSKFTYLKAMADHINLVANTPVRNRATIAGNLMIKYEHHEFPSDIFLILETVGAILTIVNLNGEEIKLTPCSFINYGSKKERVVVKSITLPSYSENVKYISYKIMPRAQNTHAFVNSGFLFKFDNNTIKNATIVYGNINSSFVHATNTEKLLEGKKLFDNSVLKQAYSCLTQELNPTSIPPDPSPEYRKKLAVTLFYKAVLSIAPSGILSPRHKSGAELLKRPISNGAQDYESNKSLYPLTEPIPKLEARAQTTGEAQYIVDLPDLPFQLYGALVLAKAPPNSVIKHINPKNALKRDGVVAFFTKKDIPGDNAFTPVSAFTTSQEELFADGKVKYYEQPIGILVGNNQKIVDEAVQLVTVSYDLPTVEPLLTVRQVIKSGQTERIDQYKSIQPSRQGNKIEHKIKGSFDIYQQYHFYMETQCCQVVPNEDGLKVYASTQWMDLLQIGISKVLNIPQNQVNVIVRRCGGAFGGKISRANLTACAAALAAWKLKQPVKLWLPLTTNMAAVGKRFPLSADYEVGVDGNGVIQYLICKLYTDVGYQFNEDITLWLEKILLTMYTSDTFTIYFNRVLTDTPVNTWMRAPGSLEGLSLLETIIEHISYVVGKDPTDVRMANLSNKTPSEKYITDLKSWSDIERRKTEIANFNKENRWKKKGLSVIPMSFDAVVIGPTLVTVSICNSDGSVQISHGGIEVGQGINTKAAQVCAYKFGISLDMVKVLPSNTFTSVNNTPTGATVTSDGVCFGVIQACDELLERIKPYRSEGSKWEDVIKKSHENFVKLIATGIYSPKDKPDYAVYGVCATEVEVDILTGQHLVSRVDIIEDTGTSISPVIDIGQVEGAFVTGLGYNTIEKIVFNYEGKILTNNTWTYHVPGAKDIPVNFNVKFPKNNPNPVGVLGSKGTGEPAVCFGISIAFALRNALASARTDASPNASMWYPIDGTTDVENVFLNSLNDPSQYIL